MTTYFTITSADELTAEELEVQISSRLLPRGTEEVIVTEEYYAGKYHYDVLEMPKYIIKLQSNS